MKLIMVEIGANQGIGYETAKSLLLSSSDESISYHVIIGSRDHARGLEAATRLREEVATGKGTVEAVQLDGESIKSAHLLKALISNDSYSHR